MNTTAFPRFPKQRRKDIPVRKLELVPGDVVQNMFGDYLFIIDVTKQCKNDIEPTAAWFRSSDVFYDAIRVTLQGTTTSVHRYCMFDSDVAEVIISGIVNS